MDNEIDSDDVRVEMQPSGYNPVNLYSSLAALVGGKIVYTCEIQAEIPRQMNKYVLLKVKRGREEIRVMLLLGEINRPCPRDVEMWECTDFFTPDEIKARRMGEAFILPEFVPEEKNGEPAD